MIKIRVIHDRKSLARLFASRLAMEDSFGSDPTNAQTKQALILPLDQEIQTIQNRLLSYGKQLQRIEQLEWTIKQLISIPEPNSLVLNEALETLTQMQDPNDHIKAELLWQTIEAIRQGKDHSLTLHSTLFANWMGKAIRSNRNKIDVFIFGHTNELYSLFEELEAPIKKRISIVYNSGCKDFAKAGLWAERVGFEFYIGHQGISASPAVNIGMFSKLFARIQNSGVPSNDLSFDRLREFVLHSAKEENTALLKSQGSNWLFQIGAWATKFEDTFIAPSKLKEYQSIDPRIAAKYASMLCSPNQPKNCESLGATLLNVAVLSPSGRLKLFTHGLPLTYGVYTP